MPWKDPIPKDPDYLIKLAFIPPHTWHHLPNRFGPVTKEHQSAIRAILNMRLNQPFMRCRGQNWAFVRAREAAGDFSHSARGGSTRLAKEPACGRCEECACLHVAGSGTKGNFYGLGPDTGHYGVYLCVNCQRHLRVQASVALRTARRQVALLQAYGMASMDKDYELKLVREEAALAESTVKARTEMQLVIDELARFRAMLDATDKEQKPTEMTKAGPVPMSDETRIRLNLDIAKVLSKLRLDDLKLDAEKYIPVEYVLMAAREIERAVRDALVKEEAMLISKHVKGEEIETDKPVTEYVWDIFTEQWAAIWMDMKNRSSGRVR